MLLSELYRVIPDDEPVQIVQGDDFVLQVNAGCIPAYLLDASISKVTHQEMALLRIELCE
jgi:hypothetical protein